MADAGTVTVTIVGDTSKLVSALRAAGSEVSEFSRQSSSAGPSFLSMSGAVATGLAAFTALKSVVEGASNAIGGAIHNAADVQMIRVNLDTLTGSAEKGADMFSKLYKMAASTPFETPELANAAQLLLSYGVAQEKILPNLRMIGDVSLGNKEKFNRLSLAFSQVQATGRLMGQDLLQMVNSGFNPLQIISEKTGKSMLQLKKDMEAGAISATMVSEAFETATSKGGRFFGGMDKGSKTLDGTMSTLQDSIGMLVRGLVGLSATGDVVKGGLFDKISEGINTLNTWITNNQATIDQWTTNVANKIGQIITVMQRWVVDVAYPWFKEHWPAIRQAIEETATKVGEFMGKLAKLGESVGQIYEKLKPLLQVLGDIAGVSFEATMKYWSAFADGAQIVLNIVNLILDALGKMGAGLSNAQKGISTVQVPGFVGPTRPAAPFSNTRASGGGVSGNTPYMVGENGPELFVPSSAGNIRPNHEVNNNSSISININGPIQMANDYSVDQFAKRLGQQLQLARLGV